MLCCQEPAICVQEHIHLGWFASRIAEPKPEQLALGLKFTDLPSPPPFPPQTWQQISQPSTD